MKIRRTIRRAIAWVVAVTVLAQTTACSIVPARLEEQSCARDRAEISAISNDQTRDQNAIFFNATIDGRRSCAIPVSKGIYDVQLVATWSDGKTEEFQNMFLDIEPGRQYLVLAHENGVGSVPATAVLTEREPIAPRSNPSIGGLGKFPPLAILVLAVAIPIGITYAVAAGVTKGIDNSERAKKEQIRSARLAMNCCHVWIEDAMTQVTIAGIAPTTR